MDKKLEKLNKMLELIQNETLTPKDVEKFLTFVLSVVQKSKESIESMSSEHINQMKDILAYVEKEHEKIISIIDEKDEEKEERFNSKISEVKSLLEEIKKIEVKDGENGKDADEEIIVEKVLSQIKLPEYKETVLDDGAEIVAKINDLDINDDDLKIDASHVKNLPKFVQNQIGGVVARNIYQMDDVVLASITTNDILKWNGTKWVNTAGFDPAVSLADVSANSTTAPLSLYTMTSTIPVEFRSSDGNSLLYLNETSEYIRVGVSALTEKFSISGANNDTFGILRVHSTGGALPNAGISLTTDVSGSGYRNWQIATNFSTGGTFEILRSTSNGGNPTTNAFTISSAGNVGIGTTAPTRNLTVNNAASAAILGFARADTEMGYFGVDTTGVYLSTSAANQIFRFYRNNGGTETVRIDASGNVAIGDTTTTYDSAVARTAITSAKSIGTFNSQLNLVDSTAQTTGVGGGLTLIGKYTDAGAYAVAGGIYAQKTNSTTGSYSFDIAFNARQSGNSPTQVMNLSALNNMGGLKIGRSTTFTPIKTLDIAGDISFDDVAEPSQSGFTAALAGAGAGNVNNGQHYYAVEFYTATGVTGAVTPVVNVTVTDLTTNGQVNLASLPVSTDPRVIGRRIYRTTAGGTSAFAYYLATIADNTTTTYTDNIADSSLDLTDRVYRKTNTTAGRFYVNSTLMLQTTDLFHTFVGVSAGASNTRGDSVVFVGGNAGNANTTGSNNTFIGYTAGSNNTTGSSNDTVGYASQLNQTTGSLNVSMGENTLRLSSAGGVTGNTAIGAGSLYQLTASSDYNTALGYRAGGGFRGDYNIHIGADAGYIATPASIGDYNINIGYQTGRAHGASADNNILIGKALELQSSTGDNQLSIGNLIFGTGVQGTGTTVSTGLIGIGTPNPVSKLHISTGVDTDSGVIEMVIGGSNGANARTGRIIKDTTTAYTMILRSGDYAGTGLGSDLRFQTNNGDGDRITIKGGTGNTGIGVTAPTAVLHLKAGTATASTAPLKFTTGTNNTTAEAGAMEYNNTFHLTNSDATRRHVATAPNTTKVTAGAPYTNDGYVVINIGGTDFKVMTTA